MTDKLPQLPGQPSCFAEILQLEGDRKPCLYLHVGGWGYFQFEGIESATRLDWSSGLAIATSANRWKPGCFIGGAISRKQTVALRDYLNGVIKKWEADG